MKLMMLCTHYITIAIVHILYCCLLLFYRDASVPYSRTFKRDSYRTLCFVLDSRRMCQFVSLCTAHLCISCVKLGYLYISICIISK